MLRFKIFFLREIKKLKEVVMGKVSKLMPFITLRQISTSEESDKPIFEFFLTKVALLNQFP